MASLERKLSAREIAEQGKILLATVGSTAHGLALPGTDDRDELGVCLEPAENVIGLQLFEQDVFRSKPQGIRSEPGDTDRTIYSARKFCRLALGGNPTIITMLYAQEIWADEYGQELLGLAPAFNSRKAGRAFLGYMTQQRQRLLGERGQMNVKRPELTERYGFDTKYAMHMLRLGYQGVEYLESGKLTLPMPTHVREFVLAARKGDVEFNEIMEEAGALERKVEDLLDTSPLPETPDYDQVNAWLCSVYPRAWGIA